VNCPRCQSTHFINYVFINEHNAIDVDAVNIICTLSCHVAITMCTAIRDKHNRFYVGVKTPWGARHVLRRHTGGGRGAFSLCHPFVGTANGFSGCASVHMGGGAGSSLFHKGGRRCESARRGTGADGGRCFWREFNFCLKQTLKPGGIWQNRGGAKSQKCHIWGALSFLRVVLYGAWSGVAWRLLIFRQKCHGLSLLPRGPDVRQLR